MSTLLTLHAIDGLCTLQSETNSALTISQVEAHPSRPAGPQLNVVPVSAINVSRAEYYVKIVPQASIVLSRIT